MSISILGRFINKLNEAKLDGFIETDPVIISFLLKLKSNLEPGEAILCANLEQTLVFHSPLLQLPPSSQYMLQALTNHQVLKGKIRKLFPSQANIGFSPKHLSVEQYQRLCKIIPEANFTAQPDIFDSLVAIKQPFEIKRIKKASHITYLTMNWIINLLTDVLSQKNTDYSPHFLETDVINAYKHHALSESMLAHIIEYHLMQQGATSTAFKPIVAFDEHSAIPHHLPSSTVLRPNSVILIDIGAVYEGYSSDMTRTICLQPNKIFNSVKQTVDQSFSLLEEKLNELIQSPVTAQNLDKLARDFILQNGYDSVPHALGHGLGREVHQFPSINPRSSSKILPNMTLALEPAIYLKNKFGYRHEDTFLINKTGFQNLTNSNMND